MNFCPHFPETFQNIIRKASIMAASLYFLTTSAIQSSEIRYLKIKNKGEAGLSIIFYKLIVGQQ